VSDFDSFYSLFEEELYSDLTKIFEYDDMYNRERAKDYSYISSLFFNGCIESGKSLTQGGGDIVMASPMLIGMTNLIDSVIVVKQLAFDECVCTLKELSDALVHNWQGY
jgi:formate C-acetyltransferase